MDQILIDQLIPDKYYPLVYNLDKEVIIKNTIERFLLKQKLMSSLKTIYKDFLKLDDKLIAEDIKLLKENDILQLTDYDKECVNYNLQPLNFVEIYHILNSLYYEKIYHNFLIVESTYPLARDLLNETDYLKLFKKVDTLRKLDTRFREICYGKNLSELYENRITWTRRCLKYLHRYINALI